MSEEHKESVDLGELDDYSKRLMIAMFGRKTVNQAAFEYNSVDEVQWVLQFLGDFYDFFFEINEGLEPDRLITPHVSKLLN